MIKKLDKIHGFWIGEDLSELEVLSIKSFLYFGHEYILWVYDNFDNIPSGVDVRDASEIIPRDVLNKWSLSSERHSRQTFANYFRYVLIEKHGGWWCDMDLVCLKPFVSDLFFFTYIHDIPAREQLKKIGLSYNIANGYFKSPKNSPYLKSIISEIEVEANSGEFPSLFGEWGTILFSKHIVQHNLLNYVVPRCIGYGLKDAERQYTDISMEIPDSPCVHFYNYLGKKGFVENSLYDKLRKLYL